jgi:release factor glutamine methyltransferase
MKKTSDVVHWVKNALEPARIPNPALDARLIVRLATGFSDADLITKAEMPVSAEAQDKAGEFLARRLKGEPLSRIAGEREFWSMTFKISPDTLDPRPDTETLVEAAVRAAKTMDRTGLKILDLGTGSGCILISVLKELPGAVGTGIDLNPSALAIAKENAVRHEVDSRCHFLEGSWFSPLPPGAQFDLILSNPPYIPASDIETLAVDVREYDPILALDGGEDGLSAYKIILKDLKKHLACGGRALFEIGQGQEHDLARLVEKSNMSVRDSHKDLAGIVRVVEMSHGEK